MVRTGGRLACGPRVVRAGPNTPQPYRQNPPDRVIEADDIVFADFGPIFEEWEADFGRTFVLGDDPVKHRLAADLPVAFAAGRAYFEANPGGSTRRAGPVTGSWRSTSSTVTARSAASTRSCSTCSYR